MKNNGWFYCFTLQRSLRVFTLFLLSIISFITYGNLFSQQNSLGESILSVDEAFIFDFQQQEGKVSLSWQIKPGYYLYQDKIEIMPVQATVDKWTLPQGLNHHDEFFGDVIIYRDALNFTLPIVKTEQDPSLAITIQGCADKGICYPPKHFSIPLKTLSSGLEPQSISLSSDPVTHISTVKDDAMNREIQSFTQTSTDNGISLIWAFVVGLGVAFTPCVLPMYPLIVGLISGRRSEQSTLKIGTLVFTYIQGMALSYTLLGIIIALAGFKFQASLQNPILLGFIAILFLILAGSMFGFYHLQMPSAIQTKLVNWSNKQKSGSYIGVFFMGAIAGLLCSPCTTAPLSAILLYIAKSGDIQYGGTALYLYALGMGLPLMMFALFGHKIMPKAGAWTVYVKEAFGFIILALPIFLLERFVPTLISELLWSTLLSSFFIWGWVIALKSNQSKARIFQIVLFLGVAISIYPLQQSVWSLISSKTGFYIENDSTRSNGMHLPFLEVDTVSELDKQLLANQQAGNMVLIDFYADWCVACRQFEKYTFSDPNVQRLLADTQLIRLDVTENSTTHQALLEKYNILGLPAILIIDRTGKEILRINGFLKANEFTEALMPYYTQSVK